MKMNPKKLIAKHPEKKSSWDRMAEKMGEKKMPMAKEMEHEAMEMDPKKAKALAFSMKRKAAKY